MTTIAYCHKQKKIAYDSRATCGHVITTDAFNKCDVLDGEYYFFSGLMSDIGYIFKAIKKEPINFVPNISCIKVSKDRKVYRIGFTGNDRRYWEEIIAFNFATGSGEHFALAVLDMKGCAKKAVDYAKTRDFYTGGDTHVFNIKKMKHE